jgi:hypothetical protein
MAERSPSFLLLTHFFQRERLSIQDCNYRDKKMVLEENIDSFERVYFTQCLWVFNWSWSTSFFRCIICHDFLEFRRDMSMWLSSWFSCLSSCLTEKERISNKKYWRNRRRHKYMFCHFHVIFLSAKTWHFLSISCEGWIINDCFARREDVFFSSILLQTWHVIQNINFSMNHSHILKTFVIASHRLNLSRDGYRLFEDGEVISVKCFYFKKTSRRDKATILFKLYAISTNASDVYVVNPLYRNLWPHTLNLL